MTLNYIGLGVMVGYITKNAIQKGLSPTKMEFEKAKYNVEKKGPNLDTIVQTSNIGAFEIKIIQNANGKFNLSEVNYDSKKKLFGKFNVYKNNTPITLAASKSPFKYKITTKNKNTSIRLFLKYGLINGSVRVNISPDKSGFYQVKKVTLYDSSGKIYQAFVPSIRKPKPVISLPSTQTISSTSTAKSSP